MASALVGFTGFVGSNLATQRKWDYLFNRSNSHLMEGKYDLVVCCAAPGCKWLANQNHHADWVAVMAASQAMAKMKADRLVLISTADVFAQPVDADERDEPKSDCHYGNHRRLLERLTRNWHGDGVQIVRLPGLRGPGLKKNAWYDLENSHRLEHLNPKSVYQWYDIRSLWKDIEHRREPVIHISPQPESLDDTVKKWFPHLEGKLTGTGVPAKYNLRTIH